MTIAPHEEYAQLMSGCEKGHFLFNPQELSKCHPGAIGFFDEYGDFQKLLDASDPKFQAKGNFKKWDYTLEREESKERPAWNPKVSESESEHSFGFDAGLSGALTAAPVDLSADAKNKWGKTGMAALVTGDVVVNDGVDVPGANAFKNWANANAEALRKGNFGSEVNDCGLWLITKTYSTRKCSTKLQSAHHRDTSGGVGAGATGIAKGGTNGSSAVKSNSNGGTDIDATETGELFVIMHKGYYCRVSKRRMLGGSTFIVPSTLDAPASRPYEITKPVYDENGSEIGTERFRLEIDENDEIIEVRIDPEAERQPTEDEAVVEGGEMIGMTEEEAEAEAAANARFNVRRLQKLLKDKERLDTEIIERYQGQGVTVTRGDGSVCYLPTL